MKQTIGKNWFVRRCAAGTGACFAGYLLLLALFSYLTVRGVIGEERLRLMVWIGAAASVLAGTMLCARKTEKRTAVILAVAGGFYLLVLLLGFLVGDTVEWGSALRLLSPVALGAGGTLLCGKRAKRGKNRAKRARRAHR